MKTQVAKIKQHKVRQLNILLQETWVILIPETAINLHCELLRWYYPARTF